MNDKITVVRPNMAEMNVDVICYMENVLTQNRYLYFTLNEVMGAGANSTVKIYVGKEHKDTSSNPPIDDPEWFELKGLMAEALKGTENPNIKYLKYPEVVRLDSEKAIAMPLNYDYVSKHKSLYVEKVVSSESDDSVNEPIPFGVEAPVETAAQPSQSVEPISPNVTMENILEPSLEEKTSANELPVNQVEKTNAVIEEKPIMEESVSVENTNVKVAPAFEKIDISSIENKYNEMFEQLQKLKENEIEAAKRYNATLELSEMHNEQHANYVANELTKEAPVSQPQIAPQIVSAPQTVQVDRIIEPSVSNTDNIETNWFDIPQN